MDAAATKLPDPIERVLLDPRLAAAERERLTRYCTGFTGDPAAAEELAQEALAIAWQHRARLQDPRESERWTTGIARNVCLRWRRAAAKRRARVVDALPTAGGGAAGPLNLPEELPDSLAPDPYALLERAERAEVVGRAVARLAPGARELLLERYLDDLPLAEIAARRGVREETAAVQLFRSRQALRKALLAPEMRDTVEALGLTQGADSPTCNGWTETRIWCPECGDRRMLASLGMAPPKEPGRPGVRVFSLACPSCRLGTDGKGDHPFMVHVYRPGSVLPDPLGTVHGFKPALNRLCAWWGRHVDTAVGSGAVCCSHCGTDVPTRFTFPFDERWPDWSGKPGLYSRCPRCGMTYSVGVQDIAFNRPEAQAFWREHPRARLHQPREVASADGPLLVTRLEGVLSRAAVEVAVSASTLRVVRVSREG